MVTCARPRCFGLSRVAVSIALVTACFLAACSASESSTTDDTVSTAPDPLTSPATASSAPDAPLETERASTTAAAETTTTSSTTLPATTTTIPFTESCIEYQSLSAYRRVLALRAATAPTDDSCTEVVEYVQGVDRVLAAAARLEDWFGVDGRGLASQQFCRADHGSLTITNEFDAPISVLVVARFGRTADTRPESFSAVVTQSIPPGESRQVILNKPPESSVSRCAFAIRPFIVLDGDYQFDAGLIPAAADDQQASSDPAIWVPAVQAAAAANSGVRTLDYRVANYEDVHSPDVYGTDGLTDTSDEPPIPATTPADGFDESQTSAQFCKEIDLPQPVEDPEGEVALIVFEAVNPTGNTLDNIEIGLFRRGSDGRWRYLGRTVLLYQDPPDNQQSCYVPNH